jgi:DNA-binding NtrC family response regulator
MNLAVAEDMIQQPIVPPSAAMTSGSALQPNAIKILVVDDESAIRGLLATILHSSGYQVTTAAGGYEARRIIAEERPALILSDLHMPEGDGWALLVFCHVRMPEIPVILVSGSGFGIHPKIEAWAAGRVAKPFSPDQLLSEIERVAVSAPARGLNQTGRAA